MIRRALALILIAALFLLPAAALITNPGGLLELRSLADLEGYLAGSIPLGGELHNLADELTLLSGQTKRDGVFCTDDGLLLDYWPTAPEEVYETNTASVINFAQEGGVPTFAAVIPTAVAVKQKLVPEMAPLFNQKIAIEEIYRAMSGQVTAIDVYPALYQRYDATGDYLYYRTAPAPTALGGFLIYNEIAERMRLNPAGLRDFDKEYPVHGYRGSLFEQWSYEKIQGDILTVYRPRDDELGFLVTSTAADGTVSDYRTLFPLHKQALEEPFGVYLGGPAARIDIELVGEVDELGSLLVFGDYTFTSYLPFLALHFRNTTFVDLARLDDRSLEELALLEYDGVLFAYSLDTFMDSEEIQRASVVLGEDRTS